MKDSGVSLRWPGTIAWIVFAFLVTFCVLRSYGLNFRGMFPYKRGNRRKYSNSGSDAANVNHKGFIDGSARLDSKHQGRYTDHRPNGQTNRVFDIDTTVRHNRSYHRADRADSFNREDSVTGSGSRREKPVRTNSKDSGCYDSLSDMTAGLLGRGFEQQQDGEVFNAIRDKNHAIDTTTRSSNKLDSSSKKPPDVPCNTDLKNEEIKQKEVKDNLRKKTTRTRYRRKQSSNAKAWVAEKATATANVKLESNAHGSTRPSSGSNSNSCASRLQPALGIHKTTRVRDQERLGTSEAVKHRSMPEQRRRKTGKTSFVEREKHGPVPIRPQSSKVARTTSYNKPNKPEHDQIYFGIEETVDRRNHGPNNRRGRRNHPCPGAKPKRVDKYYRNKDSDTVLSDVVCHGQTSDHPERTAVEVDGEGVQRDRRRFSLESATSSQERQDLCRTISFDSGYSGSLLGCGTSSEIGSADLTEILAYENQDNAQVGSHNGSFDDSVFITLTENSKCDVDEILDTSKPAFNKESIGGDEKPKILKTFKRRADLRLPSWPPQDNYLFIVDRPPVLGFKNISLVRGDWGNDLPQGPKKSPWAYDYDSSDSANSDVVTDDICESFMKWGLCPSGDTCKHRHPSCRYPRIPSTKTSEEDTSSSHNASESRAWPANSKPCSRYKSPSKQCKETYATIISKLDRKRVSKEDPSMVALRSVNSDNEILKKKYEESWPSLSPSTKKGNQTETRGTDPQYGCNRSASTSSLGDTGPLKKPFSKPSESYQAANDRAIAEVAQELEYVDGDGIEYSNSLLYGDEYDEAEIIGSYNDSHSTQEGMFVTSSNNKSGSNDLRTHTTTISYEEKLDTLDFLTHRDSLANHGGSDTNSKTVPLEQSTKAVDPKNRCDICMDAPKDATLLCGHRFCFPCAHQMRVDERQCAICRRPIVTVIKTFN